MPFATPGRSAMSVCVFFFRPKACRRPAERGGEGRKGAVAGGGLDEGSGVEDLRERVRSLADSVLEGTGIWVVDAEIAPAGRRTIVRLYIDKPGGVTIDDCAETSRAVEDALDTEDVFSGSYVLEVSSPGLERPLRRIAEYQYFVGRRVRVVTRMPVLGTNAVVGEILEATETMVALKLDDGELLSLPFDTIANAHLVADLWPNSVTPDDRKRGEKPRGGKHHAHRGGAPDDLGDELL